MKVDCYKVSLKGAIIVRSADKSGKKWAARAASNIVSAALDTEFAATKVKAIRVKVKPQPEVKPEDKAPVKVACSHNSVCLMRRKVELRPAVLSETSCGVPDSELADYMIPGASSPTGKPVLLFRHCPWCGGPWVAQGHVWEKNKPDEGDEWKEGAGA